MERAADRADLVVVAFHGGAEGSDAQHVPRGDETYLGEDRGDLRAFARTAVDAGADLVVGSGPHVVRGIEFYKGHLIAYSAGNFVGYGGVFGLAGPTAVSYMLNVRLRSDGRFRSAKMIPTLLTGRASRSTTPRIRRSPWCARSRRPIFPLPGPESQKVVRSGLLRSNLRPSVELAGSGKNVSVVRGYVHLQRS